MGADWLPFPRSEIGGELCALQRRRRQCARHPQNRIGAVVHGTLSGRQRETCYLLA